VQGLPEDALPGQPVREGRGRPMNEDFVNGLFWASRMVIAAQRVAPPVTPEVLRDVAAEMDAHDEEFIAGCARGFRIIANEIEDGEVLWSFLDSDLARR
jgi:hypothetical protein